VRADEFIHLGKRALPLAFALVLCFGIVHAEVEGLLEYVVGVHGVILSRATHTDAIEFLDCR